MPKVPAAPRVQSGNPGVAPAFKYLENHPELCRLHGRVNTHIQNQFYEDAAANLRLELEYMLLQYVKEYEPELYPENISTKISELRNRGYIPEQVAGWMHQIRKLGNKEGAHYNEGAADVKELKECIRIMERVEAAFLNRFHFPSGKQIPQEYLHQQAKGLTTSRPDGTRRYHQGDIIKEWKDKYGNTWRRVFDHYTSKGEIYFSQSMVKLSPEGKRVMEEETAKRRAEEKQDLKKGIIRTIVGMVVLAVLLVALIAVIKFWAVLLFPVICFFTGGIGKIWEDNKRIKELEKIEARIAKEKGK